MTDTTLPTPPPIDYSSRDYISILNDLLTLKTTFVPEWTSTSANDIGVALLELWAYVGDILNYSADRNANEAFLDTATQRNSVIRLARLLNYSPAGASPATVTLTWTNNTAGSLVVPATTQVATSLDTASDATVTFETDSALTVPANSTATVTATQGTTVSNEQVGTSDGTIEQQFALFNPEVIQGSVTVTVTSGSASTWTYVPHLVTSGPYDQVFTLLVDGNDVTTIVFGDGANGAIPAAGATITATYRIGGGVVGNVAAGTLSSVVTSVPAGLSVTNAAAATGGADEESTDSIRENASANFGTQSRAITLDDFANLAVSVPGVGKASAVQSITNAITVYVAPQGGGGVDGGGAPTSALITLMTTVSNTLQNAAPAPATVSILGPTYVPINITVTVHVANNYRDDRVSAAATAALTDMLSFDNVIFADTVSTADIQLALAQVAGASWTDISVLDQFGGSGYNASITLASNQMPVLGTLTVNTAGGIS